MSLPIYPSHDLSAPGACSGLTPIWTPIGANITKVDDILAAKPVSKRRKPVRLDLPDGKKQSLDPRGRNGKQRVQAHPNTW